MSTLAAPQRINPTNAAERLRRAIRTTPRINKEAVKDRMTCSDVLDRHGIAWNGQDISCPLPGHDDSNPSFGLFDNSKAFKCHGCGRGGDCIQLQQELSGQDFTAALDTLAGWAGIQAELPKKPVGRGQIVATYDYRDESGDMLFQVVRYEPKDFRQRAPNESGGWVWKMKGIRRVLYRLPAVLEAVKDGRTVYVCEGEKDVQALENAGFVATCNPEGGGKWKPEFSESLRGANVVLITDKDTAGREHTAKVAGEMIGIAARIRVLELPDRDKPVKDAADWFAAGGTAAELRAILEGVPDYKPEEKPVRPRNIRDQVHCIATKKGVLTYFLKKPDGRYAPMRESAIRRHL